jgi:hypothetical protein
MCRGMRAAPAQSASERRGRLKVSGLSENFSQGRRGAVGTAGTISASSSMRIFIGFLIAAVALYFADQHFTFGYYTDRTMMMLQHISRSFWS